MARRKRSIHNGDGFTWSWLANLGGIPLLTVIFFGVGWYFTSGQTLKEHDVAISKIQSESTLRSEEEKKAREKVRDEFISNQQKTAEGIAKLDTRLAVAETQQATMNQQLGKVVDLLQQIAKPRP